MGATEDVERIRFNTVIRNTGKRGTKHYNDGEGAGGGNQHDPKLGQTLYKHLSPLIFTTLLGTSYYYPHFRVKETEEQRDEVTCANRT